MVSYRRPVSLKSHSKEKFERDDCQVQKFSLGSEIGEIVLLLTRRCTDSIFLPSFETDERSSFCQAKEQYSCIPLLGSRVAEDWSG